MAAILNFSRISAAPKSAFLDLPAPAIAPAPAAAATPTAMPANTLTTASPAASASARIGQVWSPMLLLTPFKRSHPGW